MYAFFDERIGGMVMDKIKLYQILTILKTKMEIPSDFFGFDRKDAYRAIK